MSNFRAIPDGYMTVGQAAKKMGVTVRTLQYYDKEGVLSPSAESEGGRRLYTDKDLISLYQILSLKELGFSLDDIKNRLIALNTPADVAAVLDEQATAIKEKLATLKESLKEIEALKEEVLNMQEVDFKRYADIIVNLQIKNESYKLVKHFDDNTLDSFRTRFDKESAKKITKANARLVDEAIRLLNDGVTPDSEQGIAFAAKFWEFITEFTNGDMSLLSKLMDVADKADSNDKQTKKQEAANAFIGPALEAYFISLGANPFEEAEA